MLITRGNSGTEDMRKKFQYYCGKPPWQNLKIKDSETTVLVPILSISLVLLHSQLGNFPPNPINSPKKIT